MTVAYVWDDDTGPNTLLTWMQIWAHYTTSKEAMINSEIPIDLQFVDARHMDNILVSFS